MSYGAATSEWRVNPRPLADTAEEPARKTKPAAISGLIMLFAIAIGVTPEFNFLGIPKVRFTDLMLPFILMFALSGPAPKGKNRTFLFGPMMLVILAWNGVCLLLLGEAELTPGAYYIAKRAMTFMIAYMGFVVVDSPETFARIAKGLLWASPILSLSVILETRFKATSLGAQGHELRASGIIANQQASTGLFIVIVLCISIALWPIVKEKFLIFLSIFTGIAAILATGTKGIVISGGTAIIILMAVTGRGQKKAPIPLILMAVMCSWFFLPKGLQDRLTGMTSEFRAVATSMTQEGEMMPSGGSSSLANRVITIQDTMQNLIPLSPLYGFGTGYKQLGSLDNFYLCEWVYHGVIGLFLFMLMLWQVVQMLSMTLKQKEESVNKAMAAALLASICAMCVSGLHSESFYLIRPMEALMLLIGLAAGSYSVQPKRRH